MTQFYVFFNTFSTVYHFRSPEVRRPAGLHDAAIRAEMVSKVGSGAGESENVYSTGRRTGDRRHGNAAK